MPNTFQQISFELEKNKKKTLYLELTRKNKEWCMALLSEENLYSHNCKAEQDHKPPVWKPFG